MVGVSSGTACLAAITCFRLGIYEPNLFINLSSQLSDIELVMRMVKKYAYLGARTPQTQRDSKPN